MGKASSTRQERRIPLLNDVLPYELPLAFVNWELFVALQRLGFSIDSDGVVSVVKKPSHGQRDYISTLLGLREDFIIKDSSWKLNHGRWTIEMNSLGVPRETKPYKYSVITSTGKTRTLSLLHPKSMVQLSSFFGEFQDSVLYFTNRGRFSLRHPVRVSRRRTYEDQISKSRGEAGKHNGVSPKIEFEGEEYRNIRSAFSYRKYDNVNSFYDSAEYLACERKYDLLIRLDIASCFDSFYTHTASWVVNGVESSKLFRSELQKCGNFGHLLDHMFQVVNYGEISGICIGPELSRIFAEIVLQEVDIRVEHTLKERYGLIFGSDYEILRYVDDYFIFISRDNIGSFVAEELKFHLDTFKLHINDAKSSTHQIPSVSEVSSGKMLLKREFSDCLRLPYGLSNDDERNIAEDFATNFSSTGAIRSLKYSSVVSGSDLGSLSGYYLGSLLGMVKEYSARVTPLIEHTTTGTSLTKLHSDVYEAVRSLVIAALYGYSVGPSVSQSLKLSEILVVCSRLLKSSGHGEFYSDTFLDILHDELLLQICRKGGNSDITIEALNLIDVLTHLGTPVTVSEFGKVLEAHNSSWDSMDMVSSLVALRALYQDLDWQSIKYVILCRCRKICQDDSIGGKPGTQATYLYLSLPFCPFLSEGDCALATGLSRGKIKRLATLAEGSLFAWNVDEDYYERLALKSSKQVY